jgi:hypothetical protein
MDGSMKRGHSKDSASRFLALRAKSEAKKQDVNHVELPIARGPEIKTIGRASRHLQFADWVEEGDWGLVLYVDPKSGGVATLRYDDDHYECECDDRNCNKWSLGDDEDAEPIEGHGAYHLAICYPADGGPGFSAGYWTVDPMRLRSIGEASDDPSDGWIYIIALAPDVSKTRLKIGWTGRVIEGRIADFLTANPTLELVAMFAANRNQESAVHYAVPGRIGASEVFDCDPDRAIGIVERVLKEPDS